MKIKNMTEEQCIRIIENNYLGEHDKKGKQTDYHDYKDEINAHLWSLQDKRLGKMVVDQSSPEYEFLRDLIKEPCGTESVDCQDALVDAIYNDFMKLIDADKTHDTLEKCTAQNEPMNLEPVSQDIVEISVTNEPVSQGNIGLKIIILKTFRPWAYVARSIETRSL